MSNGNWNLGPLTPDELSAYLGEGGDNEEGTEVTADLSESKIRIKTTSMEVRIPGDAEILTTTGGTVSEWQRVALSKWQHYRDNVLPSGNSIAIAHHESGLLRCIPHLLGRPDLVITTEDEWRMHERRPGNHPWAASAGDALQSILSGESAEEWTARQGDRSHIEVSAGEPREDRFDLNADSVTVVNRPDGGAAFYPPERLLASYNDDPHRHEEDARPYPKQSLDFTPDGREYVEPDC